MSTTITLDAADRLTLADFVCVEPQYLGNELGSAKGLAELRGGLDDVRRLLLLLELAEQGSVAVGSEDAKWLADYLWNYAEEVHAQAREQLANVANMAVAHNLAESEDAAAYAATMEREGEICARLIAQLGGCL